ncbi:MAG TPA: tetratricopeptide repeat protein, partial [Ktedonobacteraceae bacterium]|nr:tetratricopeptide repeat protein [Ktedonobacteraceae bacterium]
AQPVLPEKEASIITTLEFLEQNLRSQGFVPLQPGSLSALAQETTQAPQSTSPLALSEASTPVDQLVDQTTPPQLAFNERPDVPIQQTSQVKQAQQFEPVPFEPAIASAQPISPNSDIPPVEAAPDETPAAAEPPQPIPPMVEPMPVLSLDTLLDSELETTMRRPAVRLQPMQAESSQADRPTVARNMDYSAKSADSKLTNKERLVRGYQFQLAGSYDDAMQEYRTLIRTSPESLGEVISNVRALLKLAPKYTVGYRVLGDAYMRQGEYLQAMEAYNKALTIAKKAKSQSR